MTPRWTKAVPVAAVVFGMLAAQLVWQSARGQSFDQMNDQINMMLQQQQMMTEARMMNLQQQQYQQQMLDLQRQQLQMQRERMGQRR
jgi:hypothetical protein